MAHTHNFNKTGNKKVPAATPAKTVTPKIHPESKAAHGAGTKSPKSKTPERTPGRK